MLGGSDHQRVEHMRAQSPGVGMADVGDPASDRGIQLGVAYRTGVISRQPGTEASMGIAHLSGLCLLVGGIDNEAQPRNARIHRRDLNSGFVGHQTQPGEAFDDRGLPLRELQLAVAGPGQIIDVAQVGAADNSGNRCGFRESARPTQS